MATQTAQKDDDLLIITDDSSSDDEMNFSFDFDAGEKAEDTSSADSSSKKTDDDISFSFDFDDTSSAEKQGESQELKTQEEAVIPEDVFTQSGIESDSVETNESIDASLASSEEISFLPEEDLTSEDSKTVDVHDEPEAASIEGQDNSAFFELDTHEEKTPENTSDIDAVSKQAEEPVSSMNEILSLTISRLSERKTEISSEKEQYSSQAQSITAEIEKLEQELEKTQARIVQLDAESEKIDVNTSKLQDMMLDPMKDHNAKRTAKK